MTSGGEGRREEGAYFSRKFQIDTEAKIIEFSYEAASAEYSHTQDSP